MIRSSSSRAPARRIAVIRSVRPQRTRLGGIQSKDWTVLPPAWTTIDDQVPTTAENWLSYKLMEQSTARETTPGTYQYTPSASTPSPVVAAWNNWQTGSCPPASATGSAAPQASAGGNGGLSPMWALAGFIGAAASALYIFQVSQGRRG